MACKKNLYLFIICFLACAAPVMAAEALPEPKQLELGRALAEAYRLNPALEAARAELRAVDEEYAQAFSGYRPSLEGEASYVSSHIKTGNRERANDPKNLGISIVQPLYRGGSTAANVEEAENFIKAQRALLQVREQDVLLSAVGAYVDVVRDYNLVELNLNNENVLRSHLEASRERFRLGDITKTDVSQSESRLADAVADRITAEGNLKSSRAVFERVIGLPPDNLVKPATETALPASLDAAIGTAVKDNPEIVFASYTEAAAKALTRSLRGELRPRLDLTGALERTYDSSGGNGRGDGGSREDAGTFALRATVPFYSVGGATYSRIRQSRQIEQQRRLEAHDAERFVRQRVIDAWEDLAAANAEKQARLTQIEAARTALEGVQLESDYGSRTTLDLLDAEQEYRDAQAEHILAERDQILAAYTLLATTGALTAEALHLDTAIYDPRKNFQNVKNKWIGTGIDAAE